MNSRARYFALALVALVGAGIVVYLLATPLPKDPALATDHRAKSAMDSAAAVASSSAAPDARADSPTGQPKSSPARAALPKPDSFHGWVARWKSAAEGEREALLTEGRALAGTRAVTMSELIRSSPDVALAEALSWSEWVALPPEVRALVEEPFSMKADYSVRTDCRPAAQRHGDSVHLYWLNSAEGSLKVYPTSAWREVTSKTALPVQGIRLNGEAVLRGGVVQVLDDLDAAAVAGLFPVKEGRADGPETALIGGERVTFPKHSATPPYY